MEEEIRLPPKKEEKERKARSPSSPSSSSFTLSDASQTSGYLLKASKSSTSETISWKRRYFVLRGSSLNYYSDHQSTKCKGELLLFGETILSLGIFLGQNFSLSLAEPFSLLQLATSTQDELSIWNDAFTRSIELGKLAMRGIMYRCGAAEVGGNKRKYFIEF